LMPPLSVEQGTKRLILAKKLDREDLDRYIQAAGYQTAASLGHTSSSSATLTVHIKCQLKDPLSAQSGGELGLSVATRSNTSSSTEMPSLEAVPRESSTAIRLGQTGAGKRSAPSGAANSILIPIHIIVTDENDNWPTFIGSPYLVDLNESAPIGSLIQANEIVAIDNDQQGALSTIEYSVVGGSLWSDSFTFLNPLDSRSLIVKQNHLLDFESHNKLTLKIMARDQGEPANWAITSMHINLLDLDDLSPIFDSDKYWAQVKENRAGEMILVHPKPIQAFDGDKTIQDSVFYSFDVKTNHSLYFDLGAESGQLTVKKSLPFDENVDEPFCLLVRATQTNNSQRSSLTIVQMSVGSPKKSPALLARQFERLNLKLESTSSPEDLPQKEALKFEKEEFSLELTESLPNGSVILQARAQLAKWFEHRAGKLRYQILDDPKGYFKIDESQGTIVLNGQLDYEMYRQLTARILATYEYSDGLSDSGYPKLLCDMVPLKVSVLNTNEFAPEFSHEQYNFQLSVSDLIASFELVAEKLEEEETPTSGQERGSKVGESEKEKLSRRSSSSRSQFGLSGGEESLPEVQVIDNTRALQMGQVYCADRDFGDECLLKLVGTSSKTELFRLTRDGRLYLPLVNLTAAASASSSTTTRPSEKTKGIFAPTGRDNWATSFNNQIMIRNNGGNLRRRIELDNEQEASHLEASLDRNYLNFLLAQFSNLGRLRFKVQATDRSFDGSNEGKQSQALIVISILSIDNFILHKAAPLQQSVQREVPQETVQLGNKSLHETPESGPIQTDSKATGQSNSLADGQQWPGRQQTQSQRHVMMVPASNGRSFVQIDADIISNLLAASSKDSNSTSQPSDALRLAASSGDEKGAEFAAESQLSFGGGARADDQILVNRRHELGASSELHRRQIGANPKGSFQAPSLLLVDEDGAKFVAMPAAMEVYSRQVQEAQASLAAASAASLDSKQKRAGSKLAGSGGSKGHERQPAHKEAGPTFWRSITEQLGLERSGANPMYWVNISTAIMLHIVALVAIVALVSRIRSRNSLLVGGPPSMHFTAGDQSGGSGASSHDETRPASMHSSCSSLSNSNLWPRTMIGGFSFWGSGRTTSRTQTSSESRPLGGQSAAGSGPFTGGKLGPFGCSVGPLAGGSSSSLGLASKRAATIALETESSGGRGSCERERGQQNLFGQLRWALRKVFDQPAGGGAALRAKRGGHLCEGLQLARATDGRQSLGPVSMRPLDSEVVAFEDLRDRQLEQENGAACEQMDNCISEIQTIVSGGRLGGETSVAAYAISGPAGNSLSEATLFGQSSAGGSEQEHRKQKPVSTFVGTNNAATRDQLLGRTMVRNQLQRDETQRELATQQNSTTIVSINVPGPKAADLRGSKETLGGQSSSSVLSLGSVSSSSSSRAKSSATMAAEQQKTVRGASSEDVSSLDSSLTAGDKHSSAPKPIRQDTGRACQTSTSSLESRVAPLESDTDRQPAGPRVQPQNPTHLKLRRQALCSDHPPSASQTSAEQQQAPSASGRIRDLVASRAASNSGLAAQWGVSSTSGGRREARKLAAPAPPRSEARASPQAPPPPPPPPPPPLPPVQPLSAGQRSPRGSSPKRVAVSKCSSHSDSRKADLQSQATCSSSSSTSSCSAGSADNNNKTVSPTTSVDRGYESLQSYISSSQQRALHLQGAAVQQSNQRTVLKSLNNNNNNNNSNNYSVRQTSQLFQSLPKKDLTSQRDGASSNEVPNQARHSTTNDQSSLVVGSRLGVKPSSSRGPIGGARSRPAASKQAQQYRAAEVEAYQQQQRMQQQVAMSAELGPSDENPGEDFFYYCGGHSVGNECPADRCRGSLLEEYASHTYQQPAQQQVGPAAATVASRNGRTNALRAGSSLRSVRQQPRLVGGQPACHSQQNDLIPIGSLAYNNQEQQFVIDSEKMAAQLRQYHASHSKNFDPSYLETPPKRVLIAGRQQRKKRLLEASQQEANNLQFSINQHHHQLMHHHHQHATGAKKQLTWSDQVEMLAP